MRLGKSIFIFSVFALLAFGSAAQAGYVDHGDGTVTDTGTGLMWMQATAKEPVVVDPNDPDPPTGPDRYDWEQALAYCESLDFAGHTDWRLPTAKELASLADITRFNPSINTTYFPDTMADYYWSSTTDTSSLGYAWYVFFNGGTVGSYDKTYGYYVRAVRLGQSGSLWSVPDTGQTTCYDCAGVITCPASGLPFYGQDAMYSINTPAYTKLAASCRALADTATTWDMVRDEVTGLVWEEKHSKDSVQNYSDSNDADNIYTWYDSNSATNGGNAGTPGAGTDTMDFIQALNAANYGGFSDWRMPTDKELQTIIDYGRYNPSINIKYFPDTVDYYWSSDTYKYISTFAWRVYFLNGSVLNSKKSLYSCARAVRSGQCRSLSNLVLSKSGAGAGTVASADGKIGCGSDCSETYATGTEVTLTATAGSGSTFAGWSGGGCSGSGSCTVTLTGDTEIIASFIVAITTTTTSMPTTTSSLPTTTTSVATTTSSIATTTSMPTTTSSMSTTTTTVATTTSSVSTTTTSVATTTSSAATTTSMPTTTSSVATTTTSVATTTSSVATSTSIPTTTSSVSTTTTTVATTTSSAATTTSMPTTTSSLPTTTTSVATTTTSAATTTSMPTTTSSVSTTTTTVATTTSSAATTTSIPTTTSSVSTTTTEPTTTTTVSGGPCPARKTLGEDNSKLENLRYFRDSSLAKSAVGRKVIQIYYSNADSINAALERSPALRAASKRMLEFIAPMVGKN